MIYKCMKYHVYKKFISENECKQLSEWILENQNSNKFNVAKQPGTIRKTTRTVDDVSYPAVAFEIQNKISQELKSKFNLKSIITVPVFPHGMYASYGISGDWCKVHMDPRHIENHVTYHFNIILSDYENAELFIEEEYVPLSKFDGILYPVSEVKHYTKTLTGNNPRLFWCFGYCIPLQHTPFIL